MKKINLYLIGLAAIGMAFFSSCTEEETSGPSITIDNASPVAAIGGSVTLTGEIIAEGKLKEVKLFVVTDNDEQQVGSAITSFSGGAITTDDNLTYTFRVTITGLTESCKIKIQATDKENLTSSKSIDVTVGAVSGEEINSFSAVLIGAQFNTQYGSALDADAGTVYKISGDAAKNAAASIDMLYYYGSTNKATFAAPNDESVNGVGTSSFDWTQGWSVNNATKFALSSMTSAEFDAIDDDTELTGISGLTASKVTDVSVNKVVEFITVGGKKGAFKVAALTATTNGTITINVKIQK
ncbi:MAG: hypothetical protein R6W78_15395 [Bacteroidales bacterium]